ncbi:MAG: serine protease, partial [Nitrospinota bacterium]|nr:serine protease [Nitrospinota bacterium]
NIILSKKITILILNTHVTLLGSVFKEGDGTHALTYHGLVKEAEIIKVKFPNEDDIEATVVSFDPASNLAILKLQEIPKVKRQSLMLSREGLSSKSESVFTLGYPWTNTLQDQHVLIEGVSGTTTILTKLSMNLEPIHSGGPLFNSKHEVVGMVLWQDHAKKAFPVKGSNHFAIPSSFLEKALQAIIINAPSTQKNNLTREAFISKSRNNIVLIEAR